jgi:hypothetical protein
MQLARHRRSGPSGTRQPESEMNEQEYETDQDTRCKEFRVTAEDAVLLRRKDHDHSVAGLKREARFVEFRLQKFVEEELAPLNANQR